MEMLIKKISVKNRRTDASGLVVSLSIWYLNTGYDLRIQKKQFCEYHKFSNTKFK